MAAQQLGFEVRLKAAEDGLHVEYVKPATNGDLPWAMRDQ